MIPVGTRVTTQIDENRPAPVFSQDHRQSGVTGVVMGVSYEDQSLSVLHDEDQRVVGYWPAELTLIPTTYLLVLDQDNRCQDSLHCGTLVWPLRATSLAEAEAETMGILDLRDGFGVLSGIPVDQALIYKVETMWPLDVKAIRDTFFEKRKAEEEAKTEALERELLARLLKKYGSP